MEGKWEVEKCFFVIWLCYSVTNNVTQIHMNQNCTNLPYDRSIDSSKPSTSHSAIYCFFVQIPLFSILLKILRFSPFFPSLLNLFLSLIRKLFQKVRHTKNVTGLEKPPTLLRICYSFFNILLKISNNNYA